MKKNVRGKGKAGREGYALIYAIVILIVAMAAVSGGFLTSSGQQRTVERGLDRMEAEAICQMIFERTHKIINDFITVNGDFPRHAEDNTHSDNRHVYASADILNNTRVANDLATWFNGLKAAGSDVKDIFKDYELVKLDPGWADPVRVVLRYSPSDPATPESNDPYRIYEVTVRVRNIYTKAEAALSLKIQASTGTLYNYGVFSNEDLEINPGFDWTLQGPVFTNGNVYMTTGFGKTLTIQTPDASRAENFALKSAGNIYFGYKTAIGKNYLKDNPLYQLATLGTDLANNRGREEELYVRTGSNPLLYIYWNAALYQYAPSGGSTIKIRDGSDDLVMVKSQNVAAASVQINSTRWEPVAFPSASTTPTLLVPIVTADSYASMTNSGWNYPINISTSSAFNRTILSWDYENGIQTCNPPEVNPNWKGVKNSSGSKVLVADSKSPAKVNVKAIPVGKAGLETHTLIDPLTASGDEDGDGTVGDLHDVSIKKAKFQTYANVVVQCLRNGATGLACTAQAKNANAATPAERNVLKPGSTHFLNIVPFYDDRLEPMSDPAGTVAKRFAVVVDIPVLEEYMRADLGTRRVILYVQTPVYAKIPTLDTQIPYPPVVILTNGAKVPSEEDIPANKDKRGFSVVTNGRLWVRGDFNTWTATGMCASASIKAGTCAAPPVELFCDSFGVLSNDWDSSFASSGVKKALTAKPVTQDTIVNAAIFTGMLPSLLEKANYVTTNDGVHPVGGNNADCRDLEAMTNPLSYSAWKCSRAGGYVAANSSTGVGYQIDPSGQGWRCPKGLNPDGSPVVKNPDGTDILPAERCDYYRDENTYIYYLNRDGPAFTKYQQTVAKLYDVKCGGTEFCAVPTVKNKTFEKLVKPTPTSRVNGRKDIYYVDGVYSSEIVGSGSQARATVWPFFWPITETTRPLPMQHYNPWGYGNFLGYDGLDDLSNSTGYYAQRPIPMASYPGIPTVGLQGYVVSDLKYTCVKNVEYRHYKTHNTVCGGAAGCVTTEVNTDTGPYLNQCVCGSQYSAPASGSGSAGGWNYQYGVGWPENGQHPTRDPDGNPIIATDPDDINANYLGKGVCPNPDDNYYVEKPTFWYWHYDRYWPMYSPRYSGGLENLINLLENWDPPATPNHSQQKTLYVSGVLGIPWRSTQLRLADGTLGYHRELYFTDPKRDFDFNERLSAHPPPLTKDAGFMLFSVKRQQYTDVAKAEGS